MYTSGIGNSLLFVMTPSILNVNKYARVCYTYIYTPIYVYYTDYMSFPVIFTHSHMLMIMGTPLHTYTHESVH